jgi:hypothetical protein
VFFVCVQSRKKNRNWLQAKQKIQTTNSEEKSKKQMGLKMALKMTKTKKTLRHWNQTLILVQLKKDSRMMMMKKKTKNSTKKKAWKRILLHMSLDLIVTEMYRP